MRGKHGGVSLSLLLREAAITGLIGPENQMISSIHYDSRNVRPGGLFVAIPGHRCDGHAYISEAVEKGAVAVITEKP